MGKNLIARQAISDCKRPLCPSAPSDNAALTRSIGSARTPACAERQIGANMASYSSVIFEVSPMPSQMIINGR